MIARYNQNPLAAHQHRIGYVGNAADINNDALMFRIHERRLMKAGTSGRPDRQLRYPGS